MPRDDGVVVGSVSTLEIDKKGISAESHRGNGAETYGSHKRDSALVYVEGSFRGA